MNCSKITRNFRITAIICQDSNSEMSALISLTLIVILRFNTITDTCHTLNITYNFTFIYHTVASRVNSCITMMNRHLAFYWRIQ